MKLLPCAVRGVLAGLMISIGGYVYLGCENRVVGAVFFTVVFFCTFQLYFS